jgi:FkbM family methyltransferase
MAGRLATLVKRGLNQLGLDVVRSGQGGWFAGRPATAVRPVGSLPSFLQDIAARGFQAKYVLDVGANRGLWSLEVRRVYPSARFTLVEPQVEMKASLERFCAESPGSRWINAGAGSAPGELPFLAAPDTVSSTFIVDPSQVTNPGGGQLRTVPIVTLDSLYADRPGELPDIIKIDAEGFEMEVLKGGQTLLGHAELVALEVNFWGDPPRTPTFRDLIDFMGDAGYSPYDFTWFYRRLSDGAMGLVEIVFARDHGILRGAKQ